MKKNKTLILTTLLCLLPMIFSAAVYTRLTEQMKRNSADRMQRFIESLSKE